MAGGTMLISPKAGGSFAEVCLSRQLCLPLSRNQRFYVISAF